MGGPAWRVPTRSLQISEQGQAARGILLMNEWLVTNGLGGFASGTVGGWPTRRYHGLLMAALPAPLGRTLILGPILESIMQPDGSRLELSRLAFVGDPDGQAEGGLLQEFRLEMGLPVWVYAFEGCVLEKRLFLSHEMNTVLVTYRLLEGGPFKLELRIILPFRCCHLDVNVEPVHPLEFRSVGHRWEIAGPPPVPPLHVTITGGGATLSLEWHRYEQVYYGEEAARGYQGSGPLCSPGAFHVELEKDHPVCFRASTEDWSTLAALTPAQAEEAERHRRIRLLDSAGEAAADSVGAELVLAADQFLIVPAGRSDEGARIRAEGDQPRTVIAGYHWFTDWGRDTMISLEGLTLVTGRHLEAGHILRTFAHHVREGLIPNFFPDGNNQGVYHTADATLWFFHALHRYTEATDDRGTLRILLPRLWEIMEFHQRGTRFGIHMDPEDGLLRQGQAGYQLTWMDAKVGDWVVTPRRGKAVEINALWYNALCLLRDWTEAELPGVPTNELSELTMRARSAFNQRFWCDSLGYLYDVVDGENGDDSSCRPNQVFALSLDHPVLDQEHWAPVLETVRKRLLTPLGLRTLAPGHPDYRGWYRGDLRARDAAYHQGAVWPWLLGPFIDAWLRVHPEDRKGARKWLEGLVPNLGEHGIGTIGELCDAEYPHASRGCIAQAWSVAELLRCWVRTA